MGQDKLVSEEEIRKDMIGEIIIVIIILIAFIPNPERAVGTSIPFIFDVMSYIINMVV